MCQKCNYNAVTQEQLGKHKCESHEQNSTTQKSKCSECDFESNDSNHLNIHILKKHEKVTVDNEYLNNILEENKTLKSQVGNLKDDFESLNDNNSQDDGKNGSIELN